MQRTPIVVTLMTLIFSTPSFLYAQTDGAREIEEVVVTATKREESLQDVPVAVTALSSQALERAGVNNIRDLDNVATSFNMNSSQTETGGTTLRIRGVGTTGNNLGLESAVGVFLDGVYLSRPGVALADLMDIAQIEVLRGPQGTLFGRNTSAGAISVRSKKPSTTASETFLNLATSNYSGFNVQAGTSGPLGDGTLAYRLSTAIRTQDGFLNSTTGAESRTRDRSIFRGQLTWDLSDTADIRLIGDVSKSDEKCCDAIVLQDSPARALGSFAAAGLDADGGIQVLGDSAVENFESNAEQFFNGSEQSGFSAELNMDVLDDAALTWLVSWRDYEATSLQESDFVNIDVFSASPQAARGFPNITTIGTWTSELRLTGESEKLSWIVGAYVSSEDIYGQGGLGLGADFSANTDAILWRMAFGPLLPAAAALGGVPLATGGTFADVLSAPSPTVALAGGVNSVGSYAQNVFTQDSQSWSVFTHNTFHISDELGLLVGIRWVDEQKDGDYTQVGASNPACLNTVLNAGALMQAAAGTPLEPVATNIGLFSAGYVCFPFATPADLLPGRPVTFADTYTDDELVYTLKLSYDFNEATSAYGSFTHGFKSGGFNLDSTAAVLGADPRFQAETNDAWELGLKTQFLDNRARANFAIWNYALEGFQVLEFTGVQFRTFNVPTAASQGLEIEVEALLSEELTANFGFTHAQSEYPDDCDGNDPNAAASVSSLCGAPLTNSPENVATLGVGYQTYMADKTVFVYGNYRWGSERRTSTQPGLPFDVQEASGRLNLRAGFGKEDESWMIEIWGANLTDERVRNVTFSVPLRSGARAAFFEAPRTFGATLRTNF